MASRKGRRDAARVGVNNVNSRIISSCEKINRQGAMTPRRSDIVGVLASWRFNSRFSPVAPESGGERGRTSRR
jgi:hypothetical protein